MFTIDDVRFGTGRKNGELFGHAKIAPSSCICNHLLPDDDRLTTNLFFLENLPTSSCVVQLLGIPDRPGWSSFRATDQFRRNNNAHLYLCGRCMSLQVPSASQKNRLSRSIRTPKSSSDRANMSTHSARLSSNDLFAWMFGGFSEPHIAHIGHIPPRCNESSGGRGVRSVPN